MFALAGNALSEMLSDVVIDGNPVVAEFVDQNEDVSEGDANDLLIKDEVWRAKHIRESQYLLQIVKCDDRNCCSVKRSSLFRVIKDGFLPPPIPIKQTKNGLSFCENPLSIPSSTDNPTGCTGKYISLFQNLSMGRAMLPESALQRFLLETPYDYSCPSMKTQLSSRFCHVCGRYFGSKSSFNLHSHQLHNNSKSSHHNEESTDGRTISTHSELIIPEKLLVRRGDEYLCLVKSSVNTKEYYWHGNDEIDWSLITVDDVAESVVKSGIKVYSEKERSSLWT